MTSRLAIVADDLSGAADSGAPFARAGLRTEVCWSCGEDSVLPDADVLVVSTESRALRPEEASAVVATCGARIASWTRDHGSCGVYKKIDSTLRGHPAAELGALMRALGADRALVAPAFPAQERTTVGGRQRVRGSVLELTPFGREVSSSDLGSTFADGTGLPVRLVELSDVRQGLSHLTAHLRRAGAAIWIADAENDTDLLILAAAARAAGITVLCGSGGLARAMAFDERPDRERLEDPSTRGGDVEAAQGPVLAVVGSRNAATLEQLAVAARHGLTVLRPLTVTMESAMEPAEDAATAFAATMLRQGQSVILTTADTPESPRGPRFVADRLSSLVQAVLERAAVHGLVLTGGDTASAVCRRLGADSLRLGGELRPGVAFGSLVGGRRSGLAVVTKAGGFGSASVLVEAIRYLEVHEPQR